MLENFAQRLHAPELGPCACSQVRRTARAVSSFYDAALTAADLTITQYSILTNIARAGSLKLTVLAAKLGMERTTPALDEFQNIEGSFVPAKGWPSREFCLPARYRLIQG